MSTKIDITNSINTINDGGLNTAAKVRAVYTIINNELFGTPFIGGSLAPISAYDDIVTELTINLKTNCLFSKSDNVLTFNIEVSNTTGSILGVTDLFEFSNTFEVLSGHPQFCVSNTNKLSFSTNKAVIDSIGVAQVIRFNGQIILNEI